MTFFYRIDYKKIIHLTLAMLLLSYFLFHLIKGNRGINAYNILDKKITQAQEQLNQLIEQRIDLEHKINLISSGTLNKDFLEELAKKNLSLAKPDEEIVVTNNE